VSEGGLLGGLTTLDGSERNLGFIFLVSGLGPYAPAARLAVQTSLLLVKGLRRRVHQAVYLIERLTSLLVAMGIPAHTKIGTSTSMSPPVDTISRVFAEPLNHGMLASHNSGGFSLLERIGATRLVAVHRPSISKRGHYRQIWASAARDRAARAVMSRRLTSGLRYA
jgi:hypothetical protein